MRTTRRLRDASCFTFPRRPAQPSQLNLARPRPPPPPRADNIFVYATASPGGGFKFGDDDDGQPQEGGVQRTTSQQHLRRYFYHILDSDEAMDALIDFATRLASLLAQARAAAPYLAIEAILADHLDETLRAHGGNRSNFYSTGIIDTNLCAPLQSCSILWRGASSAAALIIAS